MAAYSDDAIIRVRDLTVRLNGNLILNHLDLDVRRGEILGFVGAAGAGMSVLTRTIIGLMPEGERQHRGVRRRHGPRQQDDARARGAALGRAVPARRALSPPSACGRTSSFPVREFIGRLGAAAREIAIAKRAKGRPQAGGRRALPVGNCPAA